MAARTASQSPAPDEAADVPEAFLDAEIEAALAPFAGKLSDGELAWMREQLMAAAHEDEAVKRLAYAAFPRDVDQSGEIRYRPPRR